MNEGKVSPVGFHFLLYGPPGVGKTTLVSQMPKPVAILDLDKGSGWLWHDIDGVDVYTVDKDEDPSKEVMDFLISARTGRAPGNKYASIAIDSLSSLRAQHLQHLAGDSYFYELGDYGVATNWLRRALTLTQGCSQVVCWVTHMSEESDGPRLMVRPAGVSNTGLNHLNELLDAMVFMGQSQGRDAVVRVLATQAEDVLSGRSIVMTKDRTGLLPGIMELPGLDDDGTPPHMFEPFFKEALSEADLYSPKSTAKKSKSKKK